MNITTRVLERIINDLKEVARVSTMEDSCFGDELKKATASWRQTWIIEPVQRTVDALKLLRQGKTLTIDWQSHDIVEGNTRRKK